MRNLTITVDEDVARWARVWAAKRGTSVSRLVGMLLRQRMIEEEAYPAAMAEFLAVEPVPLKHAGRYPSRDEVHDRAALR
jgi:hypothetical protein